MLTLTIHNDGTGNERVGNYDVTVKSNNDVLWKGRVNGHDRSHGWLALLDLTLNNIYRERMGVGDAPW